MKTYVFLVTLVSGLVFNQSGVGRNVDDALLDACLMLADSEYPQDDIVEIELDHINGEEEQS